MKWFHRHTWSKWKDIRLTVQVPLNNGFLQGGVTEYSEPTEIDAQKRRCESCGKKQVRHI